MIYSSFKDKQLSRLGFGGMRMPVTETRAIDEIKATEMIDYSMANGINFYDTAYFYHGGESQSFLGKALSKYPRDSYYLANKFPGNHMRYENGGFYTECSWAGMNDRPFSGVEEVFEWQIKKCGVDFFDFYMLHDVSERTYALYTDEKLGIADYFIEQKRLGRIKHLGFSSHGRADIIDKFLNWRNFCEFALIQLNYLDWVLQDAAKKYEVLTKHGLPVFIMEPMRGGKLAAPGAEAERLLKAARPDDTPASWSFRFIQSLPNAAVVLSGMSTMEQLKENIEIFSKNDPVTNVEKEILNKVIETMADVVPCTFCRYCDVCPKNLDIPKLINMYNELTYGESWTVNAVLKLMTDDEKPGVCTKCGKCSNLCPQEIDVVDVMVKFSGLINK